jgi:hypothetical protein
MGERSSWSLFKVFKTFGLFPTIGLERQVRVRSQDGNE